MKKMIQFILLISLIVSCVKQSLLQTQQQNSLRKEEGSKTAQRNSCPLNIKVLREVDMISVPQGESVQHHVTIINDNPVSCSSQNLGIAVDYAASSVSYELPNSVSVASQSQTSFNVTIQTSEDTPLGEDVIILRAYDQSSPSDSRGAKLGFNTTEAQEQELKAFPTAEGFGKDSVGGRGGVVKFVTNLNNSGPGSLRAAVAASGPRIVVFKVSGEIRLTDDLDIENPYITIAGQTAPGGGITIRNYPLKVQTHNVIIRYLRVRLGDNGYKNAQGQIVGTNFPDKDALTFTSGANNVIVDHMSVSWGVDEVLSLWGNMTNVTIQNSIITEGLFRSHNDEGAHSMGVLMGNGAKKVTFYRNMTSHSSERHIRAGTGGSFEMINNIIYDFNTASIISYENVFSIINNIYKNGPTQSNDNRISALSSSGGGNINLTRAYINGNDRDGMAQTNSAMIPYLENSAPLSSGITASSTAQAEAYILADAGASFPYRDPVDVRVLNNYQTGTGGLIDTQEQVGGFPTLPTADAPTDNDNDGMADAWEQARGLNTSSNDSAQDDDGDGYTNIEEYVNSLVGE